VIEENHPQPDAAEKIEPEITLDGMGERYFILVGHHAPSIRLVGYRARELGTLARSPARRQNLRRSRPAVSKHPTVKDKSPRIDTYGETGVNVTVG
jgi:hypothetical protein